jgi:hypothetical protein
LNSLIAAANAVGRKDDPDFDLRNDLFGNLSDDIIIYEKPVAGNSLEELGNAPTIYLIAAANPDAMINAIQTFVVMSNPQAASAPTRDFLGRKIHNIPLRPVMNAAGGREARTLYMSSSGGYVALSTDSAIVEEFLRNAGGQNKPLRENAGLQSAMQHLGGAGGGLFGYENQRETMRITFKALQNSIAADSTLKMFPTTIREWLDFSLLPDYETISKYFYISTFASSANSEGITLKAFAPRPPNLN